MNLKFNYQVPIIEQVTIEEDFIIQGTAINATITSNNHKFLSEELEKSAETLTGVPLLIDHRNEIDAIKGRVMVGEYLKDEQKINFKAKVIDKDMIKMIKDGRINAVSVGASVTNLEETDDGLYIPRGIKFRELSLVAVGADENATFGIALKEAYETNKIEEKSNSQSNSHLNQSGLRLQKIKSEIMEENKMSEDTKEQAKGVITEGITEEKIQSMIESAMSPILNKIEEAMKSVQEADGDQKKSEAKEETGKEPKVEPKVEEPKADEPKDEDEDESDEKSEDEVFEEKGKYKVIQSHGSLSGGAFTIVRE